MPQLDGLRALAVGGVLISHFGMGHQLEWLTKALPWGHLGVRLFFVLSGFLITRILLERRDAIDEGVQTASNALLHFYGRRFLRIFPVFYLTIVIAYSFDLGHIREVAIWHALYLSNLETVIFNGFLSDQQSLRDPTSAHFWSLAVEEQFYLIWPALILFTRKEMLIKVVLAMIVIAPFWRACWFLYDPTDSSHSLLACLDSLGAGGLLAIYMKRDSWGLDFLYNRQRLLLICGSAILFMACFAHIMKKLSRPEFVLLDVGESIVFAFIVARATQSRGDNLAKFLEWNVLQYLGKISYGIYVFHAFMSPVKSWIWRTYSLPDITQSALNPLILTLMTIVTATISWYLVEKPINRLKRNIPRGPVTSTTPVFDFGQKRAASKVVL